MILKFQQPGFAQLFKVILARFHQLSKMKCFMQSLYQEEADIKQELDSTQGELMMMAMWQMLLKPNKL